MVDTPLFHLCHPRKENSSFRSKIFHQISSNELYKGGLSLMIFPLIINQFKLTENG